MYKWYVTAYTASGEKVKFHTVSYSGNLKFSNKPGSYINLFQDGVWAYSRRQAKYLIEKRGFGEQLWDPRVYDKVILPKRPYVNASTSLSRASHMWNDTQVLGQAFHNIMFMIDLAVRCKLIDPKTMTHDQGLLHNVTHWFHLRQGLTEDLQIIDGDKAYRYLYKQIRTLEQKIPGYVKS